MITTPITDEALNQAYTTAFLLTGNPAQAEASVLEGIRTMEHDNVSRDALLPGTLTASVASPSELQSDVASLPPELRRVLRLSLDLRRSYVLRFLVGLSREVCARMLNRDIHQIDDLVCASARALAGLPELTTATSSHG
jgi:hypothetical protein